MTSPQRSCVGCRRRHDQSKLIRFRVNEGRVLPAEMGWPGRSAYVCPDPACFEAAVRRRAFSRALRSTAPVDTAACLAAVQNAEGREKAVR